MKTMLRRWLRDEQGSQLIEFVLIFPLVWLLIVFSFDQFTILYNRQKALAAAYEAGRIAAVQPNFGLAKYHARERGMAELDQGMEVDERDIVLELDGGFFGNERSAYCRSGDQRSAGCRFVGVHGY